MIGFDNDSQQILAQENFDPPHAFQNVDFQNVSAQQMTVPKQNFPDQYFHGNVRNLYQEQIEMTSFQITNQPQAQTNEHLSTQQPMIGYDYDPQQNLTNANFEPTQAFQNASNYQGHPTVYNQALDTGTVNISLPQANTDYFTAPQQHPPQANLVPQNF